MWFLLAPALAAVPDDTFFPNESDLRVSVASLERAGVIRGRTGRILVGGERSALRGVAGVVAVAPLREGVWSVTPAAGVDDLELARALHGAPGVRWAHPDLLVRIEATGSPDDPYWVEQWHLENTGQGGRTAGVDINAAAAWEYASGAGQVIGILDSGVQLDHPDLSVVGGLDVVDGDEDASPDTSSSAPHGTAVAGVAAARGDNGYGVAGVAWGADVYAVRLIGGDSSLESLYLAFATTVDAGAGVLSNSWGWANGCGGIPEYSIFAEMFNYADREGRGGLGSVVVFAAGNDACDIQGDGMLQHKKLVVVAAVEWNDVRAWYSNYGEWVDIAAPTTLLTTDIVGGGYGSYAGDDALVDGFGGTSAATPVVSGVIALMMEANPRITGEAVREILCQTATRNDVANAGYDASGWSPYYGCGRIDAGAAVASAANGAPEAPVPVLTSPEVWEGRVILTWAPAADPDGDVLGYEVVWWNADGGGTDTGTTDTAATDSGATDTGTTSGTTTGTTTEGTTGIDTTDTFVDVSGSLVAGDTLAWRVRAVDPWGAGPWSETASHLVVALPVAPEPVLMAELVESPGSTGCSHGAGAVGLVAIGMGALWGGRRAGGGGAP